MRLLKQHSVLVTIEEVHTLRNPFILELDREVNACSTTVTALCLNLDYTIRTARTPHCTRCSILENLDALDIVGVNRKKLRELVVVETCVVERLTLVGRHLEDVVVNDDKRLGVTIDG